MVASSVADALRRLPAPLALLKFDHELDHIDIKRLAERL